MIKGFMVDFTMIFGTNTGELLLNPPMTMVNEPDVIAP